MYEAGDLIYLSRGTTDTAIEASFPPLPLSRAFWQPGASSRVRKVALSPSLSSCSNTVMFSVLEKA